MRIFLFILIMVGWGATPADATRYWVATTGSDANACSAIDGDEDPGVYKATLVSLVTCLGPGDIGRLKTGSYSAAASYFKTIADGTAENPIIIEGDSADADGCAILSSCGVLLNPGSNNIQFSASHITMRKIRVNGAAYPPAYPLRIDGGSHILIEDVELYGTRVAANSASCAITGATTSFITFRRMNIHDCGEEGTTLDHGIYQQGDDFTLEHSWVHDNVGFGIQCYTATALSDGRADRCTIIHTLIEDNDFGGIAAESNDGLIRNNVIRNNANSAITLGYSGSLRTKIYNNLIYRTGSDAGTGVFVGNSSNPASNSEVVNNIIFGFTNAVTVHASSSGVTESYNACPAEKSCGSVGKVSISAITDILVSSTDPRLKAGSSAVDAGTNVGFAYCGSNPDIGAFEQPVVMAASIDGDLLDVTVCSAAPPIRPLGTWTPACTGGGCGTPVNSGVSVLGGSGGIVRMTVGGITGGACAAAQTWTVSASGSNTDTANVGGTYHQSFTATNVAVDSSACDGAAAGGYIAGMTVHHEFEGNCNDSSGNANHCTTTGSPTFVSAQYGQGMQTTTGATQYATTTEGNGLNPTTQSFTACVGVYVTPGTETTAAIVPFGAPVGTNQRFYPVSASGTWRLAAQTSGASTASDLAVVSGWNRVCVVANATTDTVTVSNNGVLATTAGGTKSVTSYVLAGDIEVGHLPGNTSATAIYDDYLFYLSAITVATDYLAWQPATDTTMVVQATHQHQGVFTLNAVAENRGAADAQRTIVKGGAAAVMVQLNCTGGACGVLQPRFRYNINSGAFTNVVPDSPTADGVSYWGASAPIGLNNGAADGPISGALAHTDGLTLTTSSAIPTIELANNTSYTLRGIFTVDAAIGDVVCFKAYDQGGSALASYTPSAGACVTVIAAQSTGGY